MNADFEYKLWTDDSIYEFLECKYPEYVDQVRSFQLGVMRADFFRILALYHFGGIYVDVDFECLVPIEAWHQLKNDKVNMAFEPFSHNFIHGTFKRKLCNAFFASPPNMLLYKQLISNGNTNFAKKSWDIQRSYGPLAWSKLLEDKKLKKDINVIPSKLIYPISDLTNAKVLCEYRSIDTFIEKIRHKNFNSLAVHYWDHSASDNKSILDAIEEKNLNLIKEVRSAHKSFLSEQLKSENIKKFIFMSFVKTLIRILQFRIGAYR